MKQNEESGFSLIVNRKEYPHEIIYYGLTKREVCAQVSHALNHSNVINMRITLGEFND